MVGKKGRKKKEENTHMVATIVGVGLHQEKEKKTHASGPKKEVTPDMEMATKVVVSIFWPNTVPDGTLASYFFSFLNLATDITPSYDLRLKRIDS